jgi:hypothetical protein
MSKYLLDEVAPDAKIRRSHLQQIVGVCGERHQVLGQVDLTFKCNGVAFTHNFHVFENLHSKILVGLDFLKKYKVQVNFSDIEMTMQDLPSFQTMKVPTTSKISTHTSFAKSVEETIILPHSETLIPVRIDMPSESIVLLEPNKTLIGRNIAGGRTVIQIENSKGVYRMINPTSAPVFIKKNQTIAKAVLIDNSSVSVLEDYQSANISNVSATSSSENVNYEQIVKDLGINIENKGLTKEQKNKLYTFLGRNRDIFAKDLPELGETNLHSHVIETGNAKNQ